MWFGRRQGGNLSVGGAPVARSSERLWLVILCEPSKRNVNHLVIVSVAKLQAEREAPSEFQACAR